MPKSPKWNEVRCPACREPIAVDASRCPHCQTLFSPEDVAKRKKEQSKGAAAGCGCLASVGVLIACVSMYSGSHKAEPSKRPAQVASAVKPEAPSPSELKAATTSFYRDIMTAMKPCDAGAKKSSDTAGKIAKGRASIYDGYAAAKEQVDGCRDSEEAIAAVTYPGEFSGQIKDAADKAIEVCRNAATVKQMAGETMLEVYDGDTRPSKVEELKERSGAGRASIMACVATSMTLAQKVGADIKEMSE